MRMGRGTLTEILLDTDGMGGRIACAPERIPAPGQYLLAHNGSDLPLGVALFNAGPAAGGFVAAAPLPPEWSPGARLRLRGPLGRGFSLPIVARRVALVTLDGGPSCLLPLIPFALRQNAAVTLVATYSPPNLPDAVEVQPHSALAEVAAWADYLAVVVRSGSLANWSQLLRASQAPMQVLVRTPMPCAGIADCGICAVSMRQGWKLACKDGPVLDADEILGR